MVKTKPTKHKEENTFKVKLVNNLPLAASETRLLSIAVATANGEFLLCMPCVLIALDLWSPT